jgi:hypothetical protein
MLVSESLFGGSLVFFIHIVLPFAVDICSVCGHRKGWHLAQLCKLSWYWFTFRAWGSVVVKALRD